jgi:hypothetical protein
LTLWRWKGGWPAREGDKGITHTGFREKDTPI